MTNESPVEGKESSVESQSRIASGQRRKEAATRHIELMLRCNKLASILPSLTRPFTLSNRNKTTPPSPPPLPPPSSPDSVLSMASTLSSMSTFFSSSSSDCNNNNNNNDNSIIPQRRRRSPSPVPLYSPRNQYRRRSMEAAPSNVRQRQRQRQQQPTTTAAAPEAPKTANKEKKKKQPSKKVKSSSAAAGRNPELKIAFEAIDVSAPDEEVYADGWVPSTAVMDESPDMFKHKTWRWTPIDIQAMPYYDRLHAVEADLASKIRLTPETYLRCKRAMILAAQQVVPQVGRLSKNQAQKLCRINVNKTSILWNFFKLNKWIV